MKSREEIAAEISKLKHALKLKNRWNAATRQQIEGQIEVLEMRMDPEEVEARWYVDETAEEYRDGDNDLWIELDATARWMAGEEDFDAPSKGLPRAPTTTIISRDPPPKLSAFVAFILALFNSAPIEPQVQMAALAVPAIVAVSQTTTGETRIDESADCLNAWQSYQASLDFSDADWLTYASEQPRKHRRAHHSRQHHRANFMQRLADKTVNRELRQLRRSVGHLAGVKSDYDTKRGK